MTFHQAWYGIVICDAYQVKRKDMNELVEHVRFCYPDNVAMNNRTDKSIIREWRGHNLLYHLHLFREHTKDVDIEYPQKYKWIWWILGW